MKKLSLSTIFGICTLLVGCWWIIMMVNTPFKEKPDYLFLIIFQTMMSIPGGLAVYFGYRLIKEKSKKNIKGSSGTLVFVLVSLLGGFFLMLMPNYLDILHNKHIFMLSFLLTTILIIPIYILTSRFLMLREGLILKPKGEFVGKGIISFIAVQIWLAGVEIARPYEPKEPWGIIFALCAFGPIIIACVFYKVATRFIKEDKAEQSESSNPAPVNHGS